MLDLSDMKELQIDVEGRTAWAETGLTAVEYTTATGAHGLATGFGDTGRSASEGSRSAAVSGIWCVSTGSPSNDLLAAEIVTADGELRWVDAETHPDLYWAIRGGGGNFGVATRFQFRLHEVDSFVGGMLFARARWGDGSDSGRGDRVRASRATDHGEPGSPLRTSRGCSRS